MINQLISFFKKIFEGPLSISFFRFLGYTKPYRVAIIRALPIIFKKFRPHYHSIIYECTQTALKLNLKKVSVVEFGVAGGNGLLTLEKYCKKLSRKYQIEYEIYGFDFGDNAGLNFSKDPKDLPYFWTEGQFKMNYEKLKSKLTNSKLVLGDIANTVKNFADKSWILRFAPIYSQDFLLNILRRTRIGKIPFVVGNGKRLLSLCNIENVSTVVEKIISGEIPKGIYNLSDSKNYTYSELLKWQNIK